MTLEDSIQMESTCAFSGGGWVGGGRVIVHIYAQDFAAGTRRSGLQSSVSSKHLTMVQKIKGEVY